MAVALGKATPPLQNRQRHLQVGTSGRARRYAPKPASSLDYLALLRAEYQAAATESRRIIAVRQFVSQPLL